MNEMNFVLKTGMPGSENVDATDAQLLARYVDRRDPAAFETLVVRHGPMVLGICRRIVGRLHDAEDAFQAAFLSLAQAAHQISRPEMLPNWLYTVARHAALQVKKQASKTRQLELQLEENMDRMLRAETTGQDQWSDLASVLDEEMGRLSDDLRIAVILCDIQGKTRKEAAQYLGVPEPTLSTRLSKARSLLSQRLKRQGIALSGGAIAVLLLQNAASAAVQVTLISSTVQTVGALAAAKTVVAVSSASKLASVAQQTMLFANLKIGVICLVLFSATVLALQQQPPTPKAAPAMVLPMQIDLALKQNAQQLKPISVGYTVEVQPHVAEKERSEWQRVFPAEDWPNLKRTSCYQTIWQYPNFYTSRSSKRTSRAANLGIPSEQKQVTALMEWSFDGSIQYRGEKNEDPLNVGHLSKKSKSLGRLAELPEYYMTEFSPYFHHFSGLTFQQNGPEFTSLAGQSVILHMLESGGEVVAIENVDLDEHPHVKIEVMADNPAKIQADQANLTAIESRIWEEGNDGHVTKLEGQYSPETQVKVVENIRTLRKLPQRRRYVFFLDPALNYAIRRSEEWIDPDQLLVRCLCSHFEKIPGRELWLPRHAEREVHELKSYETLIFEGLYHHSHLQPLFYTFHESYQKQTLDVQELISEPLPVERFRLNYTEPGVSIYEEIAPEPSQPQPAKSTPKAVQIGYKIGQTPEETKRNKLAAAAAAEKLASAIDSNQLPNQQTSKLNTSLRWLLPLNGILLLLGLGYFAIRRFSKS